MGPILRAGPFSAPQKRRSWADPDAPIVPLVPVAFSKDGRSFTFFSAITTLGTPQDVTLQELRIECFFPMDDETDRQMRALLADLS